MSIERARAYLAEKGVADRIRELDHSSATVELAAEALGVEPARIAKTLSFMLHETPILIVAATQKLIIISTNPFSASKRKC